jgi:hypothetical protein
MAVVGRTTGAISRPCAGAVMSEAAFATSILRVSETQSAFGKTADFAACKFLSLSFSSLFVIGVINV